jgi:hypothetical protein
VKMEMETNLKKYFILLFITFTGLTYSNQIFYDEIPLKRVVEMSEIILQVKRSFPIEHTKEIPVIGINKRFPDKMYPFREISYNFTILKVLMNSSKRELKPNDNISVLEAFNSEKRSIHERYYLEGVSKSPIYETYKTKVNIYDVKKTEEKYIIFIRTTGKDRYEFAAENSIDFAGIEAMVMILINSKK